MSSTTDNLRILIYVDWYLIRRVDFVFERVENIERMILSDDPSSIPDNDSTIVMREIEGLSFSSYRLTP